MTVSALVLNVDPAHAEGVSRALARWPGLCLGPRQGDRLPVVLETEDAGEGAALARRLLETEGILGVDLVAVHFDDEEEG